MSNKSYDRIKNYTTSISVERTITEIEKMLAKFGATKIMKEYDLEGNPNSLIFSIITDFGEMPVKLPIKTDKVQAVFKTQVEEGLLEKKYGGGEWAQAQARRVGWRVIKDWLDAQMTLIKIHQTEIQEIFLPYAYDGKTNTTLYEQMKERKFAGFIADSSIHKE